MRAAVEDEAAPGLENDTSASVISTSLGVAQRVQAVFYVIGIVHFESILLVLQVHQLCLSATSDHGI